MQARLSIERTRECLVVVWLTCEQRAACHVWILFWRRIKKVILLLYFLLRTYRRPKFWPRQQREFRTQKIRGYTFAHKWQIRNTEISSPRHKQTRQYKVGGDETKKNPLSKQSDGGNGSGTVLSIRDWGAPFCLLGVIAIWGSHWHTRLACFGWPHTVRVLLLLLFCFILSHVLLCTAGNSWEKVFALWAPVFV